MAKKSNGNAATAKAPTKSQLFSTISEKTELSRKQVGQVLEILNDEAVKSLKKHGQFTLPGLAKMVVKKKPATKARQGINPFTKEPITIKAKPASKAVRIRPVKSLKELVA